MRKGKEESSPLLPRKRLETFDRSPPLTYSKVLYRQHGSAQSSAATTPLLRPVKKDRFFVFGENFNRLIDEQDPLALHLELDERSRRRNIRTFLTAMFGVVLMVIENFINWDGQRVIVNTATQTIKILISISTVFLVIQILEHYHLVSYKIASGFFQTAFQNIPVVMKHKALSFVLEILVCMYHIPPFMDSYFDGAADKYGIFMFARMYLILRVIRDNSPIYRNRVQILQRGYDGRSSSGLDGWVIHIRRHFEKNPGVFMVIVLVLAYLSISFAIYVHEREKQDAFTFPLTLWYTAVTMMTIGYGDYSAVTTFGRIYAALGGIIGLLISSLSIAVTTGFLSLNRREKFAVDWVSKAELDLDIENSAATVIQCWWRMLKLRNRGALTPSIEYRYGSEVIQCIVKLRRYRKELAMIGPYASNPVLLNSLQLEGRYDPILDRILVMERSISDFKSRVEDIHGSLCTLLDSADITNGKSRTEIKESPLGSSLMDSTISLRRDFLLSGRLSHRISLLEQQQQKIMEMMTTQNALMKDVLSQLKGQQTTL
eukprot:TRINITY_DN12717_c0_g1_i2.p1 TRINITY_DN12717_c0_g1~~TRINITY_DN12717_c0_g1_i2.p1  ORF type:complete len:544 (+),score=103.13 TRINITY_DN12717_c0_g1_i2:44-1675(+)